jgi:hypothetical protein
VHHVVIDTLRHNRQQNRQNDKYAEDNARSPGEYIAGFSTESRVSPATTERAAKTAASTLLEQDQHHQTAGDEHENHDQKPVEIQKHINSAKLRLAYQAIFIPASQTPAAAIARN